jgi:hypothetical protein
MSATAIKAGPAIVVVRAIAIAVQKPYQEIYDAINALALTERTRSDRRSGAPLR